MVLGLFENFVMVEYFEVAEKTVFGNVVVVVVVVVAAVVVEEVFGFVEIEMVVH